VVPSIPASRVTAHEDEPEPVVRDGRRIHLDLRHLLHLKQASLHGQRLVAPDAVDGSVARGRHQPDARVGGGPVPFPALRGDRERLLIGFLGEIEVAEEADQGGEDASPLLAEDLAEVGRHHSTSGRTSIAPPMLAAGIRAASSIASSRSSASKNRLSADGLLELDERAVSGERPPVLHAHGGPSPAPASGRLGSRRESR
jgi:hypothetical protein